MSFLKAITAIGIWERVDTLGAWFPIVVLFKSRTLVTRIVDHRLRLLIGGPKWRKRVLQITFNCTDAWIFLRKGGIGVARFFFFFFFHEFFNAVRRRFTLSIRVNVIGVWIPVAPKNLNDSQASLSVLSECLNTSRISVCSGKVTENCGQRSML